MPGRGRTWTDERVVVSSIGRLSYVGFNLGLEISRHGGGLTYSVLGTPCARGTLVPWHFAVPTNGSGRLEWERNAVTPERGNVGCRPVPKSNTSSRPVVTVHLALVRENERFGAPGFKPRKTRTATKTETENEKTNRNKNWKPTKKTEPQQKPKPKKEQFTSVD